MEHLLRSYRETLECLDVGSLSPAGERAGERGDGINLTFSFPLGEFKAVRRIRPEESEMLRTLFDIWVRQITEP
ncbi:MAG TPA: hypothetical protein VN493_27925 [Thermoanaerobaculia bacterium]|nr:hypothetical protein [Thermoanaerobaculia bacterium]